MIKPPVRKSVQPQKLDAWKNLIVVCCLDMHTVSQGLHQSEILDKQCGDRVECSTFKYVLFIIKMGCDTGSPQKKKIMLIWFTGKKQSNYHCRRCWDNRFLFSSCELSYYYDLVAVLLFFKSAWEWSGTYILINICI